MPRKRSPETTAAPKQVLLPWPLPDDWTLRDAVQWIAWGNYPVGVANPMLPAMTIRPLASVLPVGRKPPRPSLADMMPRGAPDSMDEERAKIARFQRAERAALEKLSGALKAGTVCAAGRPSPGLNGERETPDCETWPWRPAEYGVPPQPIPANFWEGARVHVQACNVFTTEGAYFGVSVPFASLWEAFPPPPGQPFIAEQRGNWVVTGGDRVAPHPGGAPPRYDWDAFTAEAVRVMYVSRPEQFSAFLNDMLDWFAERGITPSSDSARQRLQPIWDGFKAAEVQSSSKRPEVVPRR
jgi:hypothetical protein